MNRTNLGDQGQGEERAEERQERTFAGGELPRGGGRRDVERERQAGAGQADRLRQAGQNLGAQIEEQIQKRPYVVLGAAAGVGFVAGSLFGSRLGQMLLALGVGYVAKNVTLGDLGFERLEEGFERLAGPERARR